jgi:hypothetical protein
MTEKNPEIAVDRAAKAEALLLRFTAEAHRRKWSYDRGLDDDGVPIKSEAFDALHRLGEEMRVELDKLRATAPAAAAVRPPASDRTADREQLAAALREHYLCTNREEADADGNLPCRCGDWREPGAEADDENDWDSHLADAVLAVLPAPVEDHRLALSMTLGLGTSASWDAIHDRATELGLPPLDQDPVARRLGLLPEPADRAAVLREAADAIQAAIDADRAYSPARSNDRAALGGARQIVLDLIDKPRRPAAAAAGRVADDTQPEPSCAECGHPHGVHQEGDDPVTPGTCEDCPDDERHDYEPAAVSERADDETRDADRGAVLLEIATKLDQLAETDMIRKRRSLATARRLLAGELRLMAADAPAVGGAQQQEGQA